MTRINVRERVEAASSGTTQAAGDALQIDVATPGERQDPQVGEGNGDRLGRTLRELHDEPPPTPALWRCDPMPLRITVTARRSRVNGVGAHEKANVAG